MSPSLLFRMAPCLSWISFHPQEYDAQAARADFNEHQFALIGYVIASNLTELRAPKEEEDE